MCFTEVVFQVCRTGKQFSTVRTCDFLFSTDPLFVSVAVAFLREFVSTDPTREIFDLCVREHVPLKDRNAFTFHVTHLALEPLHVCNMPFQYKRFLCIFLRVTICAYECIIDTAACAARKWNIFRVVITNIRCTKFHCWHFRQPIRHIPVRANARVTVLKLRQSVAFSFNGISGGLYGFNPKVDK